MNQAGTLDASSGVSPTPERTFISEAEPTTARRPRRLVPFIIATLAVIGGLVLWFVLRAPTTSSSVITLSGRIEGDDSSIASKTSGRILDVRFREGDTIHQGDIIAVLDDAQIRARENEAKATVAQAQARVSSAEAQIGVLDHQLLQNQLQVSQSKADASGRVQQAEAELAAAQSDYAQQNANLQLAEFDRDAYTRLAKSGAVSERQGKEASSKADAQLAAVNASKRRIDAAQGALTLARSNLANPAIRNAQSAAVQGQILQQQSEVASSQAQLSQAQDQLAEAEANRQDLTIHAPFDGVIVTRAAEPGEVITAGTAVVTMVDLTKVYLRGFVPEGEIGGVKLGQSARVYIDSASKSPLDAVVLRIDPQATFTPENTYFRNDRVKQVVGVKLQLKAGFGYAKPGMPADGEILIKGSQWPGPSRQK